MLVRQLGDTPVAERPEVVNAVALTHPERIYWPRERVSKRELVAYYDLVAPWILPHVLGRPISMVRCPGGIGELATGAREGRTRIDPCFFHKHPGEDFPGPFERVTIVESAGPAEYLTITEAGSLTALAQMGVLEIHVWGSTWPDIERPDLLVFDLDPDAQITWRELANAARLCREVLGALGLKSFVKTTGGKGLHVVAPVAPSAGWEDVSEFCRRVAEIIVEAAPDRFTATMSKAKRTGKIYVDHVRNNRGATSIAPYSTRARDRAPVAVPLRWKELSGRVRPDTYTLKNLPLRLRGVKGDPWGGYAEAGRAQTARTAISRLPKS